MSYSLAHLRVLLAVGQWRSMSRAAAALDLSQPAVSKSLRVLERLAGVPLIIKLPRGIQLTDAGEALFVHARTIVESVQAADDEMTGFRTTTRGTLRIAASTTIARYMVPPLLRDFVRQHPGVTVRLDSQHSRFIGRLLLDRQVDIALVEAPVVHARIRVVPWVQDRSVVVAGAGHPLARRKVVTPAAIATTLLLVREPGSGAHAVTHAALRERGMLSPRQLVVDCHEAMKAILATGVGVAVMPERVVAADVKRGVLRLLPVEEWNVVRQFSRLSVIGRRPSALARAWDALIDRPTGRG